MSGLADEGSPLDDYLKEVAGEFTSSSESGRVHPAESSWAGPQPNHAGPSTPPKSPIRKRTPSSMAVQDFPLEPPHGSDTAERFKYSIYSSGLLEKDWTPRAENNDVRPDQEAQEESLSSTEPSAATAELGPDIEGLVRIARERWDIVAAVLALLLGLLVLGGWRWAVGLAVLAAASATWVLPTSRPSTPFEDTVQGAEDIRVLPGPEAGTAGGVAEKEVLKDLETFLTSCRNLDVTLGSALDRIPRSAPISTHRGLRLAVHQLTLDMTDHLASATSNLLSLVDKKELAMLGEMFDVPFGSLANGISRPPVSSGASPSPKRPISQGAPSPLRELKTSSLSFRTNKRLSLKPSRPHSASVTADDRFTAMPERTPRISKRTSWDPDAWEKAKLDSPMLDWTKRRRSLRLGQRKIEEVDDESSSSAASGDRSTDVTSPSLTHDDHERIVPAGSAETPSTPGRHASKASTDRKLLPSPMSRQGSNRRSLQSFPVTPAQSSPGMGTSPEIRPEAFKRISLQHLPYASSDGTLRYPASPAFDSHHTRPSTPKRMSLQYLPYSPDRGHSPRPSSPSLQELRSRSHGTPTTSSPARSARSPSDPVSPLTLPALKAACLGTHLKRRRLACCLLGLDLSQYTEIASAVLLDLANVMDTEREVLQGSMLSEQPAYAPERSARPAWPTMPASFDKHDFAPTISERDRLVDSVRTIRAAMERAWEKTDEVLGGQGDVSAWASLREDLGEMIRAWERGRPSALHPPNSNSASASTPVMPRRAVQRGTPPIDTDMPPFLRDWGSDSSRASSPLQPTPAAPEVDRLPPPGLDAVYEADLAELHAGPRKGPLDGMSREERIRLNKEAREKGVSLKQYLEGDMAPAEQDHSMAGSMVVDELKGMIDLIRQRKTRSIPPL